MVQDAGGINRLADRNAKGGGAHDWANQLLADASSQPTALSAAWDAINLDASNAAFLAIQQTLMDRHSPRDGVSPTPTATAADASTIAVPTDAAAQIAPQANASAAAALYASALPASVTPAYPALYVFGGSLSDVGNAFILNDGTAPVAPYYDGTFSNGPLWIEDYAAHFDLPALTPSLDGGDDFAVAGAQTGASDISTNPFDLPDQLAAFDTQVPNPVPGALYSIEIGANDLDKILNTGAPIATLEDMVGRSVQSEVAVIGDLAARGATNFLLPNVPDLGKAPLYNVDSVTASDASNLTAYYNAAVESALVPLAINDHLDIDIVDTYSLVDQVVADPSGYGFANVTDPVWSGGSASSTNGTLAESTTAGQDTYLFWDHLHPTATGQAMIAATAENLVFR